MGMCWMNGKVVFRLDDITPGLNEEKFDRVIYHLLKYGIRPLLGLVPDNLDPELQVQSPSDDFWVRMRQMVENGHVDIAQHGYQHLLYNSNDGILNQRYFLTPLSEFAGRPHEQQYEMIRHGRLLLQERGLFTDIWMAPNHSFDQNTLCALRELGFTRITDGVGLYPYYWQGLLFVPQQLGRVRRVPLFGTWTICLHTNKMSVYEIERLAEILPRLSTISFPGTAQIIPSKITQYANAAFQPVYAILRAAKK